MSNNSKDSELNDDFIMKHIKMIKELYEGEKILNEKINNKKYKKVESFELFDRGWLENWKNIVGYENLKEKIILCKTTEDMNKKILDNCIQT